MRSVTEVHQFLRPIENTPYNFRNGPSVVNIDERAFDKGFNCQFFVHLFYARLGSFSLPKKMLSKEIFEDYRLFRFVGAHEKLSFGDIFFFGKGGQVDPRTLHLAVYIGGTRLAHISANGTRSPSIWSFETFSIYPKYQALKGVKRLRGGFNQAKHVLL